MYTLIMKWTAQFCIYGSASTDMMQNGLSTSTF